VFFSFFFFLFKLKKKQQNAPGDYPLVSKDKKKKNLGKRVAEFWNQFVEQVRQVLIPDKPVFEDLLKWIVPLSLYAGYFLSHPLILIGLACLDRKCARSATRPPWWRITWGPTSKTSL